MSEKALAAAIWPNRYGSSTIGVKKSAVCRSRPPPNGTYPASSRVSIPLTNPSTAVGASPLRACSRSPGANFDAQPALVEYFVILMRVRPSIIIGEYTRTRGPAGARPGREGGPRARSRSPVLYYRTLVVPCEVLIGEVIQGRRQRRAWFVAGKERKGEAREGGTWWAQKRGRRPAGR